MAKTSKALVPSLNQFPANLPKNSLIPPLLRRDLPARRQPPAPDIPRHRAILPASHNIPMGFRLVHDGKRYQEVWINHTAKHPKGLITIATARSGKLIDQGGNELAVYGGMIGGVAPALVINDKKGELVEVCGRARYELGDTVYKVDPFGVAAPSPYVIDACLNVLDGLTPHDTTEIITLTHGLLVQEGKDPHWIDRGRQLAQCIIANMLDDNNEPANLPYLMTVLGLSDAEFIAYMEKLKRSPVDLVRNYAGAFTAKDSKENKSIVSSTLAQLGFLNDTNVKRMLSGQSSFRWDDLKRGGISVFFCLPERVASSMSRLSRIFWTSGISSLYRPPFAPVLMVIDEASNSLGSSMELFEHAFALGAGFGLRIHLLFQNLPQLRHLFGDMAESIMSSAGALQFFGINDHTTAQFVIDRAGHRTESHLTESFSFSMNSTPGPDGQPGQSISNNYAWQHFDRTMWTEQQLFHPSKQIIYFENIGAPVLALRKPYWLTEWKNRFDKNPYVKDGK